MKQRIGKNLEKMTEKQDDVNGVLFVSKKDASKSLFIPAVGYAADGLTHGVGRFGFVWAGVLNSKHNDSGQEFGFISFGVNLYSYFSRCSGLSVRGVIG